MYFCGIKTETPFWCLILTLTNKHIMKTLKLTLAAIFSIGLLTAVLPAKEAATDIVIETPNHEIDKPIIDATVFRHKKKAVSIPQNG